MFRLHWCLVALAFATGPASATVVDLVTGPGFTKLAREYERQVAWPGLTASAECPPVADAWLISFPRMFGRHTPEARAASLLGYARLTVLAMKHALHVPDLTPRRVRQANGYVEDLKQLVHISAKEKLPVSVLSLKIYAEADDDYGFAALRPAARQAVDLVVRGVGELARDPARDLELVLLDLRVLAHLNTPESRRRIRDLRRDATRSMVRRTAGRLLRVAPCDSHL